MFGADVPFIPLPGKEEGQKGSGAGDREDEKTGVTGVGLTPPPRPAGVQKPNWRRGVVPAADVIPGLLALMTRWTWSL